jgi:hypothetical protein
LLKSTLPKQVSFSHSPKKRIFNRFLLALSGEEQGEWSFLVIERNQGARIGGKLAEWGRKGWGKIKEMYDYLEYKWQYRHVL